MRQSDDNHIPMDQIGAPDEPVRLHLPADSRYLRLLRLVASSMAADLGFPVDELEEVRVAVDELGSALLADGIRGGIDVELSTSRRTLHVRAARPPPRPETAAAAVTSSSTPSPASCS